jgi:hypothetical protein
MPIVILLLGGLLGALIGTLLGGGMVSAASLPVYGPVGRVLAALLALGPGAIGSHVLQPITTLFGAGLALLVATVFIYLSAALSVLAGAALGEFLARGMLIGIAASVNALVLALLPWFPTGFVPVVFVVQMLALVPVIAINRGYQSVLGLLGWVLPLNFLMLPLGVLMFLVAAPFAMAGISAGTGSIRFDFVTWTIETSGGLVLRTFSPAAAFNIGNFTFLPAVPATSFTAGVSAHEAGHTLNGCAFGGFVYWIGAYDQNVPPLRRRSLAYTEMLANGHFGGVPGPSIPMW